MATRKEITNSLGCNGSIAWLWSTIQCSLVVLCNPHNHRKSFESRMSGTMATMTVEVDDEESTRPPRKRVRSSLTRAGSAARPIVLEETPNSRRLFAPFRALGLITNQVPFALQVRAVKGSSEGPRLHILTCMGNSWALWEGGKMVLLFVGERIRSCSNPVPVLKSKPPLQGLKLRIRLLV